jgi:hypothetical protein
LGRWGEGEVGSDSQTFIMAPCLALFIGDTVGRMLDEFHAAGLGRIILLASKW